MKFFYQISLLMLITLTSVYASSTLSVAEQGDLVKAHNKWRSQVKVNGLIWSSELAGMAQDYAHELEVNQSCRPIHSETENVGENLYWASPLSYSDGRTKVQIVSPTHVIAAWANEKADYHYASNSCAAGKVCGHYTQIIWEKTKELGCAKAVCQDKSQVWVCNYLPAGNYIGQKPY